MYIYLTTITTFAIFVFLVSFSKNFNKPEKRRFRGIIFLALGISSGIPLIHLIFFPTTIQGFIVEPSIFYWVLGGASYIFGALLYITRFPEKYVSSGYFDILVIYIINMNIGFKPSNISYLCINGD